MQNLESELVCETGHVSSGLDVIVIGAGVSGLAALAEIDKAGLNAMCLEARDRIGGRILTIHDRLAPIPIELGAEFVHGKPREVWDIVESQKLAAYDCTETALSLRSGSVTDSSDAWLPVDALMKDMQQAAEHGPDQTFSDFLQQTNHPENAKQMATSYVEGFNAAEADVIGIASLARDARAADSIHGERAFRILNGYDAVPFTLLEQTRSKLQLNWIVQRIEWQSRPVRVFARSSMMGGTQCFEANCVIITVPLGVLQAPRGGEGWIEFDPVPTAIFEAANKLRFGEVVRVVLRFDDRVWERNCELADAGFLLSNPRTTGPESAGPCALLTGESEFPTWWTPLPIRAPLMTGWSAGRRNESLLGRDQETVIGCAIKRLAQVLAVEESSLHGSLRAAYYHDWHSDPFARGAYSYVPAGSLKDHERMAEPVEDVLYFAGEATEITGHGATVHGAIASGRRAAQQLLGSRSCR